MYYSQESQFHILLMAVGSIWTMQENPEASLWKINLIIMHGSVEGKDLVLSDALSEGKFFPSGIY